MAKVFNRSTKLTGESIKVGTYYVNVLEFDADDNVTRATGADVPTDGDKGFAKGCRFIQTDGAAGTIEYVNEGSASSADFNAVVTGGAQPAAVAVTATADGLTTGLIPAGARHVTVTSANADYIATLPAAVVGNVITIYVGANGCELRTPASSNVKINGQDSDGTKEAALPATTLAKVTCVATTDWILEAVDELGAVITAIVPD